MREAVALHRRAFTHFVRVDGKFERRLVAGRADQPLPGRTVWPLGTPYQPKRREVRQLVAERGIAERGVVFQEGCECDAARSGVGTT